MTIAHKGTDSQFTLHSFKIVLPGATKQFRLVPVGDIHWRSDNCDADRFNQFIKNERERGPDSYYLFMGDEIDALSSSERKIITDPKLHETTAKELDRAALERCRELLEKIEFMRGRIVGWILGNHYWLFQTDNPGAGVKAGMTSAEWLCNQLGCRLLGYLSYIRATVTFNISSRSNLDIVACHGKAGGKLIGTSINQVDDLRVIFPEAHIFLMGHDHKRGAWPVQNLCVSTNHHSGKLKLREREQWLCRTGAFLRAYVPNESSYPVANLYRPNGLGTMEFIVTPQRQLKDGEHTAYLKVQALG